MSLPPGLTTAVITGSYIDATGAAGAGSVSFTPTSAVYDAAGKTVLTQTAVTAVLSGGTFATSPLPCTDNAGLTPLGWAYSVSVSVAGAQSTFTCSLPHALGSPVDITQLPENPVTLSPSGVSYLPDAATVPTTNPSLGGGFLYAQAGNLYWLGAGGAATEIGPAQGNVLTTLGDMPYEGASGEARLPGNVTVTRQFLTQAGTGTVSAPPAWAAIAAADLPGAYLPLGGGAMTGPLTLGGSPPLEIPGSAGTWDVATAASGNLQFTLGATVILEIGPAQPAGWK